MTSIGRLKRSCVYAIVAVIFGTLAPLAVDSLSAPSSRVGDLLVDLLGMPLAPGYYPLRGMFEKLGSCSSVGEILGPMLLVLFVSVVIDAGLIFAVWEFVHWKANRGSRSDNLLHIN